MSVEWRLKMISDHTIDIMQVWSEAPESGIHDPMVLVSDSEGGDTVARHLGVAGRAVALVSASELVNAVGTALTESVVTALNAIKPGALFVVCIAHGGSTAGYVGLDSAKGKLIFPA